MLSLLSQDLIALEGHYHKSCYRELHKKSRTYLSFVMNLNLLVEVIFIRRGVRGIQRNCQRMLLTIN